MTESASKQIVAGIVVTVVGGLLLWKLEMVLGQRTQTPQPQVVQQTGIPSATSGSRPAPVLESHGTAQPVWLGFANDTSPQDRESELRTHCGDFTRAYIPVGAGNNFAELCCLEGTSCDRVCDWEGRVLSCNTVSQGGRSDGSPVASSAEICRPQTILRLRRKRPIRNLSGPCGGPRRRASKDAGLERAVMSFQALFTRSGVSTIWQVESAMLAGRFAAWSRLRLCLAFVTVSVLAQPLTAQRCPVKPASPPFQQEVSGPNDHFEWYSAFAPILFKETEKISIVMSVILAGSCSNTTGLSGGCTTLVSRRESPTLFV